MAAAIAAAMRPGKPAIFDLEMRPNRSLPERQFRLILAGVAIVFLLMGLRFLLLGAWPILPFMLADIALLWWALRASYRAGRESEHLRLDGDGLELVRIAAHGGTRRTRLEARRARVELERLSEDENRLWLRADGERHRLGSFLSPAERVDVARVIEEGLARYRAGRR